MKIYIFVLEVIYETKLEWLGAAAIDGKFQEAIIDGNF